MRDERQFVRDNQRQFVRDERQFARDERQFVRGYGVSRERRTLGPPYFYDLSLQLKTQFMQPLHQSGGLKISSSIFYKKDKATLR